MTMTGGVDQSLGAGNVFGKRPNALAPHLGQIPLVFLTALTDGDSELRARRLGTDDYVAKLIDFVNLSADDEQKWNDLFQTLLGH